MNKKTKPSLTEGSVLHTLFRLTIPMLIGIFSMIAFNLIDTFYVGQLGTDELAAISFTFPVVLVIGSISMGLGVGTSSVISRALGQGNKDRVQRLTTDSLILALIVVLVLMILGLLTVDPLFQLLGATENLLVHIRLYMYIWYPGIVFVIIPMVGNNAIRASGDTKTPSTIMMTAVMVNAVLDPLLIFGLGPFPKLGLAGAAIATVTSRAITLGLSFYILYKKKEMISLSIPELPVLTDSWKKILYVSIPAAGANLIGPLVMGIITGIVAAYGTEAVAGFGVGTRIETFALTPVHALSSVLAPFIGQNYGAKKDERIQQALKISHLFSFFWGIFIFIVFLLIGKYLAALFNENIEVINYIFLYMAITSLGYGFRGMSLLTKSGFNALNKPLHASSLAVLRMVILTLPLIYLGSHLFQVSGIFGATAIANCCAGITAVFWIRRDLLNKLGTA